MSRILCRSFNRVKQKFKNIIKIEVTLTCFLHIQIKNVYSLGNEGYVLLTNLSIRETKSPYVKNKHIFIVLYYKNMDEPKDEINLETFFSGEIKNPFSYDINLNKCENNNKLFEEVKQLFIKGLMYKTKDENIKTENEQKTILINKVTNKEIDIVKQYMLSVGIEVVHKEYNGEDKDYYIRGLLYELERKFKNIIKIDVTMNWFTQLIHKVHITLDKTIVKEFNKIIRKHPEANYFLKLYTPEKIEDFYIFYNKENIPDIMHVIYFKNANIVDYQYRHKFASPSTKHIK